MAADPDYWIHGETQGNRCSTQLILLFLLAQLENIGNFVRAITDYGLKPHDIFEANDLFENVNHTQVQCTLIALAGMVRTHTHYFYLILCLTENKQVIQIH